MHKTTREWTFHFSGDVNLENLISLTQWIEKKSETDRRKWMSVMITSGGGLASFCFAFVDYFAIIRRVQRLQTVAMGEANSMATMLFVLGNRRVITKRSTLYLHEMTNWFGENTSWSTSEMHRVLSHLEYQEKIYSEFIAERSGKKLSPGDVLEMMRRETRIHPMQALEYGLAHEILRE